MDDAAQRAAGTSRSRESRSPSAPGADAEIDDAGNGDGPGMAATTTRGDAVARDETAAPGAEKIAAAPPSGVGGLLRRILASARDASESLVRPAEVIDASKEASVARGTSPQTLQQEMNTFLGTVDAYAKLELKDALSDFECLEQMNRVSYAKYGELASTLGGLSAIQDDMQAKYEEMRPVLEEVDRLHATVLDLERVVEHLESYSERLVTKASNALH